MLVFDVVDSDGNHHIERDRQHANDAVLAGGGSAIEVDKPIDAAVELLESCGYLVLDTQDKATVERLVRAVNSILPVDLLASEKRANTYARIAANAVIKEFTKAGAS